MRRKGFRDTFDKMVIESKGTKKEFPVFAAMRK